MPSQILIGPIIQCQTWRLKVWIQQGIIQNTQYDDMAAKCSEVYSAKVYIDINLNSLACH